MAKNEAASREINDQIEEAHQLDPPGRRFQIACECALKTCGRAITITVDEYRHVRMDPRRSLSYRSTSSGTSIGSSTRTTVSP
jgi:hypothetical protein